MATHLVLIVALALRFEWQPRQADLGLGRIDNLVVTIAGAAEETADSLHDVPAAELTTSFTLATPPPRYPEDEPASLARLVSPPLHSDMPNRDSRAQLAMLLERPAVSLDDVSNASRARGPREDGLGAAPSLANQPAGPRFLRGGQARTSVFGAVGEGRKFAYVFDRSGSMDGNGGAPLRAAKNELIASLEDLKGTHQFQIVFYNEHPRVFNPTGVSGKLVFGTEQNKYLAQKFVRGITADGATRHEEALEVSLKWVPDVIFFLTDADEPRLTSAQLARIARLNNGTTIHAIEFGVGPQQDPDNFLVKLARQNGGKHVYVNVAQLPGAERK